MDEHDRLTLAFVQIGDVDAVVPETVHGAGIDGYARAVIAA
jgi:hypothetical protein